MVLWYISDIANYGIFYGHGHTFVGWSKLDWARELDTRRLTIGYVFFVGSKLFFGVVRSG